LLGSIDAASAGASPAPAAAKVETAAPVVTTPAASAKDATILSPAAQKIAAEAGVNPSDVAGTGKDGRVTKGDVLGAMSAQPAAAQGAAAQSATVSAGSRVEERVRMTRLRKRIAERLKESQQTAAILTTFNEVDMSYVMALRNRYKETFEKKFGTKLGFMSFFVKAAIHALKEIPAINAEIDGDDIVYKHFYDIGVAVGTEQGLVVPVVRNADQLSFAGIEKTIAEFGKKARDGKLTMQDLSGGTFTVSNGGVYGSLLSTPIINPPQSGILGMHKTMDRAVVIDGKIEVRPMMYLALSYDHRLVDGKEAVTFLVRVKEAIESPERLLLEL
jgi:2-oxoglutarate dehydrogenase E2 component (dihydrolipoamide succinyltransferase)